MVLTSAPSRARVLTSTETYFKTYFSGILSVQKGIDIRKDYCRD